MGTPGGSINPQGIKKGSKLRSALLLAQKTNYAGETMSLDSGDFDGYEASIAAVVYNDPSLTSDLLSGKSIHGLWGSAIYSMPYEEIMATKDIPETEENGYYRRSKRSFFLKMYDGQLELMATVIQLPEEEVYEGQKYFELRYPGVAKAKEKMYKLFQAMKQPDGIGTAIIWDEPQKYIESFLGFKRYFTLEFSVIKALFELAQNPTEEMKSLRIKVKRRDRTQSASGALQSAVYSAAFTIQSAVIRAAVNHVIQSPGGEMTKKLQYKNGGSI